MWSYVEERLIQMVRWVPIFNIFVLKIIFFCVRRRLLSLLWDFTAYYYIGINSSSGLSYQCDWWCIRTRDHCLSSSVAELLRFWTVLKVRSPGTDPGVAKLVNGVASRPKKGGSNFGTLRGRLKNEGTEAAPTPQPCWAVWRATNEPSHLKRMHSTSTTSPLWAKIFLISNHKSLWVTTSPPWATTSYWATTSPHWATDLLNEPPHRPNES